MKQHGKLIAGLALAALVTIPSGVSARTWWSKTQVMNVFADGPWSATTRYFRNPQGPDQSYSGVGNAQVPLPSFEANSGIDMYIFNPRGEVAEILTYASDWEHANSHNAQVSER